MLARRRRRLAAVWKMPTSFVSDGRFPLRVGLARLGCVLAPLVMLFALLTPTAAGASTSLVLSSADFSTLGLHPAASSAGSARRELDAGIPDAARALVHGALIQSSAASGSGRRWRSDAFVLRSSAFAARVLTSWRIVHRARRVVIGAGGGVFALRARGRAVVQVLWRERARLGLLVLTATRDVAHARQTVLEYLALADSFLNTPLPRTKWAEVLGQIRPNGTVSERTALEAFALAYGPLPGISVPAGSRTRIPSGTLAGGWLLRYLPRLSPGLRRVVDRDLGFTPGGTAAHVALLGDVHFHQSASLTATANGWASVYADAAHLDHPLDMTIVAGITTSPMGTADGDAYPVDAAGRESDFGPYCRIRLPPAVTGAYRSFVLAHEVFHCFEFDLDPDWASLGAWLREGMAEWAALSVDPLRTVRAQGWLFGYLETSHTPLFERSYDALGFFGHVQDSVGGLWRKVPRILNDPTNEAAFATAGGSTESFLSSWGSSVFRAAAGGPPWEMFSPVTPPGYTRIGTPATEIRASAIVAAIPWSTSQYNIEAVTGEPVVLIAIDGHARLGTTLNITDLTQRWFCMSVSCACPPGTTGTIPPTLPLASHSGLGVTGDPYDGTAGSVLYFPLSEFCRPIKGPPPGGGGSLGCGSHDCASSGGDPHLTTLPGLSFPFQAAGEFTLLKSTTDDLDIQVRQQPFGASRYVSLNTAVAMRVARATVEVQPGRPDHPVVWVDGKRLKSQGSVRLAGGGRLSQLAGTTVIVTWPDRTEALLSPGAIGPGYEDGVDVSLKVAPARVGHLTGLLGDAGTAGGTELVGGNGRRYSDEIVNPDTAGGFALLYKRFAPSWRISQRDSLFVYPRGKDTNSYAIDDFPSGAYTVQSLSATAVASSEQACASAGVSDPAVLDDCILDVGATGDGGFAAGAAGLQAATGGPAASAGGVSPIRWTELSLRPDNDPLLIASLAPAGRSIVAAYARDSDSSIETDSFAPTTAGVGPVTHGTPFTGWRSIGNPLLFGAPAGGIQMIFSAINNSAALTGTLIAERQPDGTFGPLINTNSGAEANLARGAVLASDGMTPVWTNTYGPFLTLERGATHPLQTDLSSLVAGDASIPTLAHDRSGRLWMAWYELANNPDQSGLYLVQLDPTGDGVAPGASPQLAPDSQTSDNLTAQPALACSAVCRLVYEDTHTPTQLDSWSPGQARPTEIARDSRRFSDPTAAYTADGRLWVTWGEPHSDALLAKLGDATGAGGSPILAQTPPGYATALNTASTVDRTQLVLVTNWQTGGNAPTTAVFATTISAGP